MAEAPPRSPLERFLTAFADVRGGEGGTVLLLTANVFLLLTTYYLVKPVREALILAGGGAELKSYTSAGQAFLLLFAVPAYASLASRVNRRRLIDVVTVFFAICLVAFWALAKAGVPYLGVAFFLWVGIFNLMVIAQFWSFANDVYSPEQGKRLFAIVAFGASIGAVAGSGIAGQIIRWIGVEAMLLVAAALLVASLGLTHAVEARQGGAKATGAEPVEAEPLGNQGAFRLVLGNRYLLLIAVLMALLNWVNTTGEYVLGSVVQSEAARHAVDGAAERAWIGEFYASFFFGVNALGLTLQLIFVSRILKYLGVRFALLVLPVLALGAYGLLSFVPVLAAVRWAKTAENATDYSLQNTVRNVLFLPTTREEKYKAKQAIDTFFVRSGDLLSAALVWVGTTWFAFGPRNFAMVNLVLVVAWILIALAIGREYLRKTAAVPATAGQVG
ncbi:MAG: MFS transporter [bacterium]